MLLDLFYPHSTGIARFGSATILRSETMLLDELGNHIKNLGEFKCNGWLATYSFTTIIINNRITSTTVSAPSPSLSSGFPKRRIDSKTPGINTNSLQVYK